MPPAKDNPGKYGKRKKYNGFKKFGEGFVKAKTSLDEKIPAIPDKNAALNICSIDTLFRRNT